VKLETELKKQRAKGLKQKKSKLDLPLDVLKKRLDKAVADNREDRIRLSDLESELREKRLRLDQFGPELAEWKSKLSQLEAKPLPDTSATEVGEARRVELLADRRALASRIKRLEMERLSHAPRQALLKTRMELAQIQLERSGDGVKRLQERINKLLAEEAKKARQAAQEAERGALGKHQVLREEAAYNSELSSRLELITRDIEQVLKQKELVLSRLKRIILNRERVQQQVELVGLDEPLGELLLNQSRMLPDIRGLGFEVDGYRRQMSLARRHGFRLGEELQQLAGEDEIARFIRELQPANLTPERTSIFVRGMKELLGDRVELLKKLAAEYDRYDNALGDLSLEQQQLGNEVTGYREFLNKNLVWIPNAPPFGLSSLVQLRLSVGWLLERDKWTQAVVWLWGGVQQYPVRSALVILVIIGMLVLRRRMLHKLEWMAPKIGKVNHDKFSFSIIALFITLLLAAPPVLALAGVGWLLTRSGAPPFVWAVGTAALKVSVFFLLLQAARYLLVPNGLVRGHLRWDSHAADCFGRSLRWLTPLLISLALLFGITEWQLEEIHRDSLGRVASMVAIVLLLWFSHVTFNPNSGALIRSQHRVTQSLRQRALWYAVVLSIPVALLVMVVQGYLYTAVVLGRLIFYSFGAGVVILLLLSFAQRWLLVAQRRLALRQARARREAAQVAKAAKEAADAAGEGLPEVDELEAINLATISQQTQRLLRMIGFVSLFAALFLLWSELTPALGWIDEIVLWQHQAGGEGHTELVAVSLWDLLLAMTVVILMIVAGRNLPGLLEMVLLQPLALKPGNRYAVTSISRYLIFAVGFLVALSMVGISWDDVQWLVAAMGVGLGFGLKEIFANFFSGLIILFERPIRIGDTVTIGGLSGTVTRIRIRATTVTDWDNKEQVIPNQNFLINPLINWTLSDPITRVVFNVGIAYGSDTEQALRVMTEVVQSHPEVLEEPRPTVFFIGFGDSSLDFQVRVFVRERVRRLPLTHDLHMALNKALQEAGIEIPFPQRDLHLRSVSEGIEL